MRCFIAIELSKTVHERIAQLQERLRGEVQGIGWTRAEQIHLTTQFLGEVADADMPRAIETTAETVNRFEPFDLTVAGAGCFPPHGPARVLWVGVQAPPVLFDCQKSCEQALAGLGFPPENRPYHPHLTLGRVKDFRAGRDARATIEKVADFDAGGFTATELVMFQSELQRSGPIYTAIARMPLGGESSA